MINYYSVTNSKYSLSAGDCVTMSLRGSETTEAISQCSENKEIAALPSVARNDKPRITTRWLAGEDRAGR